MMNPNFLPKTLMRVAGALCVTTALLLACSDDDDNKVTTPTTTPDSGGAGDAAQDTTPANDIAISIDVTYNGTQKGPILMSAWATPQPGIGTPAGNGANDAPTLPGTNKVTMKNVKPGKYFVFGYVMVGPSHPTGPIDGDPVGPPTEVEVVEGKTATGTMMLFDPAPPDGGTDAPADAPADG